MKLIWLSYLVHSLGICAHKTPTDWPKKTWRCPGKTHAKIIHILLFLFPAGDLRCGAELLDLAVSSPWRAPR